MSNSFPKPAGRRSAQSPSSSRQNRNRPSSDRKASGRAGMPAGGSRTGGAPRPPVRPVVADEADTFPDDHPQAPPATEQAPLVPGVKPVLELLQATPERVDAVFLRKGRHGKDMERIVDLCRAVGVRFSLLDTGAYSRIYSGKSQGVVARLFEAGFVDVDELLDGVMDAPLPLILVLDQVQDPGNAGTLARTLYSMGGAGLIAPRHNGAYLGAAASKAAAGALEKLPVAKAGNLGQALDKAAKLGFTLYGASSAPGPAKVTGDSSLPPHMPVIPVLDAFTAHFRLPAILVLGSEESGIRPSLEKRCDFLISIPMLRDFDSLNVAQAGGIIISCFARTVRKTLAPDD